MRDRHARTFGARLAHRFLKVTGMPAASSAAQEMFRLVTAYWTSQAVGVAARLGLADVLAGGPRHVEETAQAVGANADALFRLLRLLAMVKVVAETSPRTFQLTELGETLRSDAPGSLRPMAAVQTAPGHWLPWGRLIEAVRTGRPVARAALGKEIYAYYAEQPEEAAFFNAAMGSLSAIGAAELLRVYDFSDVGTLADIGGGHGTMLAAIMRAHPGLRGILFDLPEVVESARDFLASEGVLPRCRLVAGDFFESVPSGADVHLLKHVVHNWDEPEARQLLRNCRRALSPEGRLLIMEFLVPADNRPNAAQPMDLNMLVNCGGRERTEGEYGELLSGSGLRLERVIATQSPFAVIEAAPN
jgi:SAM-dependent methyltransferase